MCQKVCCTLFLIGLALQQVGPCAGQVKFNLNGTGVPTPTGAVWIVSGDFNGDGLADVATANAAANSISVFLGNGDGTFHAPANYSAPSNCEPTYLAVGDFNNDHKPDLFGSCVVQGSVFILPGHGDGTFGAPVTTLISQIPFLGFLGEAFPTAAIADFNGDGILDVMLQTLPTSNSMSLLSTGTLLLLGQGDGSFKLSPQTINLGGQNPFQIATGDFNGDGKADLAVVTFLGSGGNLTITSSSLQIGIGDGKGDFAFSAPLSLNNLPDFVMTTGDMNGDGKIDIVLAGPTLTNIATSTTPNTGIVIFLGRGDGTFQQMPVQPDQTPSVPLALILADVQDSGKPDVVAVELQNLGAGGSEGIAVYPNPGNGTLQSAILTPEANGLVPLSLTVADVNQDGFADVITIAIPVAAFNNLQSNSNGLLPAQSFLAQFPSATLQFLENQTLPSTFTDANSATYQTGSLATSSIAAAFAAGLATTTASAPGLPLPTSLGGVSINVTDSKAVTRAAPLFYVSPKQINFEIPDGTATGPATVAITNTNGTVQVTQQVVSTSGGIFNASNIAAADVYTYNGLPNPVVSSSISVNTAGALVPAVINLGAGAQQVYLILFGTGIRNHVNPVTATVGSVTIPVAYAGPQGGFVGEDQMNILLPQSLAGAGLVNVTLNVDGQKTNAVQIQIQ